MSPPAVASHMYEIPLAMLGKQGTAAYAQYRDTHDLYGLQTSPRDMPSFSGSALGVKLRRVPHLARRDKLVSKYMKKATVRARIRCAECGRYRAVFSGKKLTLVGDTSRRDELDSLIDATEYVCGMMLFEPENLEDLTADELKRLYLVRASITCQHGMQRPYLTAERHVRRRGKLPMFPPCCAHCGEEAQDSFVPATHAARPGEKRAWPLCTACQGSGKKFVIDSRRVVRHGPPGGEDAGTSAPRATEDACGGAAAEAGGAPPQHPAVAGAAMESAEDVPE